MTSILGIAAPSEQSVDLNSVSVNGVAVSNSASKFWLLLLREVDVNFTGWDSMTISAPVSNALTPAYLDPAVELQKMLDDMSEKDARQVMADTVGEMELLGPPAPAKISVMRGGKEVFGRCLAEDFVDAEIFLYLAAWIYEWSGMPASSWGSDQVRGPNRIKISNSAYQYSFSAEAERAHISEGLYEHALTLRNVT